MEKDTIKKQSLEQINDFGQKLQDLDPEETKDLIFSIQNFIEKRGHEPPKKEKLLFNQSLIKIDKRFIFWGHNAKTVCRIIDSKKNQSQYFILKGFNEEPVKFSPFPDDPVADLESRLSALGYKTRLNIRKDRIEIAELSGFKKADLERMKNTISTFRPPN